MMDNTDLAALKIHRIRVDAVLTFQEFKQAQLDLLDYMIASAEATNEEELEPAYRNFSNKFDKWASMSS